MLGMWVLLGSHAWCLGGRRQHAASDRPTCLCVAWGRTYIHCSPVRKYWQTRTWWTCSLVLASACFVFLIWISNQIVVGYILPLADCCCLGSIRVEIFSWQNNPWWSINKINQSKYTCVKCAIHDDKPNERFLSKNKERKKENRNSSKDKHKSWLKVLLVNLV